jgi:hypothetical protein
MRDAALEPLALGPGVLGSEAEGTRVLRSNLELLEMRLLAVVEMVALEVTLLLAETEKELLGLIEFEDELVECGVGVLEENPGGGAVPFAPAVKEASGIPLEIVALFTQFDDLGVLNGPVGVTVSPTV